MPEEGDKVRVCFPDDDEQHAYAANACYCNDERGLRDNPDNKFIRTANDKEILLTPEYIRFTNNHGLSVVLDDKEGIQVISDLGVSIESSQNIDMISAEQINIQADGGVILRENNNSITIRNGIRQNGASVRYQ